MRKIGMTRSAKRWLVRSVVVGGLGLLAVGWVWHWSWVLWAVIPAVLLAQCLPVTDRR